MKVLFRVLLFVAPIVAVAWLVERTARPLWPEAVGPGMVERIDRSFADASAGGYDVLVVGNSRVYRGVNPDLLGARAYNFAQDDDAFNQVYYKLKYLDERGVRFHTIVMGVDYFEFSFLSDRRNVAYSKYLGDEYLRDFASPDVSRAAHILNTVLHPIDEQAFNNTMIRQFTRPASLLLERAVTVMQASPPRPPIRAVLKPNGQYILDAGPQRVDPIRRDATRLPIQEQYFKRILQWAAERKVSVVMVMPPLRKMELDAYPPGIVDAFDDWLERAAADHGAAYVNFARDPGFTDQDFADVTHLTEAAADRWSRMLGDTLRSRTTR
ncbi:MAG: DUF1574 domain-containing protein [Cyanobacteria bacterium]|nr:DUF1574 domain-containing protein [Cyanobacteriota bacterium]